MTAPLLDAVGSRGAWGIAVGFPGPVDLSTGRLVAPAGLPRWAGVSVSELLTDRLGIRAIVENDVRVAATAEAAQLGEAADVVVVKLGMGIGCAVVEDGRVHRGARGAAGEIGHVRVAGATGRCRCGNTGCLETVAAGWALIERMAAEGIAAEDLDDVLGAVEAAEPAALAAVREAGRAVGDVLAVVVNVVNPAAVVLAGPLTAAGESLTAGVREAVYQQVTPLAGGQLELRISDLGDRTGVIGAARLILQHVLAPDAIDELVGSSGRRTA